MAQAMPRYCPRCGTPTRADMQFCATCKLPVAAMLSRPGNPSSFPGDYANAAPQETIAPLSPQQEAAPIYSGSQDAQGWRTPGGPAQFPPLSPVPSGQDNWNAPNYPGAQQQPWSAPAQQPATTPWNVPDPAYPSNNPALQGNWGGQVEPLPAPPPQGRRSAGRVFLVLVILLALVGGGVFAFLALGGHLPGTKASQSTIKTTSFNSTLTYAGATITILTVQQAQNFVDDPQTASNGMLRVNLQEQNTTNVAVTLNYNQSARLISQGKPALSPTYVKAQGDLAPNVTQKNVIDFTIANGGNLSNLILQIGTDKEAQIMIPLNGQANLSQYQAKTMTQKGQLTYFGLDWTLTKSTTSLSLPNQQASHGMEFLTIDLTIDNMLSQQAISGSPFDYMRIKIGSQAFAPISTTVPVSFATGDTGKKGTSTFLIPQNTTTCTLLMLSQDPGTSGQATLDFQIG